MSRNHGPWTVEKTTLKYENDFIRLCEDQVIQPDGNPGAYAMVEMTPGIGILPIDEEGNVYLIQQFRYALGKESIEAVCGGIDNGEPPLQAAQRELKEEMGIEAADWIDLGVCDPDTSIVQGAVYLFAARGLHFGKPEREGTEDIETVKMPLADAVHGVLNSRITHGPSCIVILKAHLTGATLGQR